MNGEKNPPQINMHKETSAPNAVHCITYIEKDKMKALRWNLGDASLEYSKWKYFTVKHVIQSKSIYYYDGFGNTFDHVIRVAFHFSYLDWEHRQLFCCLRA